MTTSVEATPEKESEEEKVRRWCAGQFLRLGFEPSSIERLMLAHADYREAARLLKKGRGHLWIVSYLE